MLRRSKHSKIEVVAPEEEEDYSFRRFQLLSFVYLNLQNHYR